MPLSAVVRERCRALLPAGTEIRYLFPASVSLVGALVQKPFIIAITDKHVILLECSWLSHDRPKAVHTRYRRAIRLGPVDTAFDPVFRIAGIDYQTWDEYVSVIRAADAEIAEEDFLPPDPLPDL
ncbi:hypothetical protein Lesp02_80860 [Lentzea sp. NBRC 105346]|uniref:hypothetical protein n=1 Tax=Lentzea sp. NBRC 105346 TaxID=3032205 RepID=UPI0024A5BC28|nr:hypothetical protein [Lentzea sp. NBRC 105346]GLZ35899.1 hypothetical protein Lesp02_80860 [Lentzea sp. NBRC 105346]